jgi:hypothetical protein
LNGEHQFLVYADPTIILGDKVHSKIKNREALLVASKEFVLEVIGKENSSFCVFMSRRQNAGQNHNAMKVSKSFENLTKFTYLQTEVTDQSCILEDILSRSNSGNACSHSVQNR